MDGLHGLEADDRKTGRRTEGAAGLAGDGVGELPGIPAGGLRTPVEGRELQTTVRSTNAR